MSFERPLKGNVSLSSIGLPPIHHRWEQGAACRRSRQYRRARCSICHFFDDPETASLVAVAYRCETMFRVRVRVRVGVGVREGVVSVLELGWDCRAHDLGVRKSNHIDIGALLDFILLKILRGFGLMAGERAVKKPWGMGPFSFFRSMASR